MAQAILLALSGTHRLSPSGPPVAGSGIPLRMATSTILNSGGSVGLVIEAPQRVSTDLSGATTSLEVLIQQAKESKKYLIEALVPVNRQSSDANSGGTVELVLVATSSSGGSNVGLPLCDGQNQDFPATDATGGEPSQDSLTMAFAQEVEFSETTMGPNWRDGDEVTLFLTIQCSANLDSNAQVHVGPPGGGFTATISLGVTEIG